MSKVEDFLSAEEEQEIVAAIIDAEKNQKLYQVE